MGGGSWAERAWPGARGPALLYRRRRHIDASKHDAYDADVRTTVDLDPDIDARLRALARERGVPLRVVLNDALRAGLRPASGGAPPYVLPSRRLGLRPGTNVDKALSLAGELEDEEILRKLELRK
jgi:hypothetical protein